MCCRKFCEVPVTSWLDEKRWPVTKILGFRNEIPSIAKRRCWRNSPDGKWFISVTGFVSPVLLEVYNYPAPFSPSSEPKNQLLSIASTVVSILVCNCESTFHLLTHIDSENHSCFSWNVPSSFGPLMRYFHTPTVISKFTHRRTPIFQNIECTFYFISGVVALLWRPSLESSWTLSVQCLNYAVHFLRLEI